MLSIQSMPTQAGHHARHTTGHKALTAHRSVTSLSSNENTPYDDRPNSPKPAAQQSVHPKQDHEEKGAVSVMSDANPCVLAQTDADTNNDAVNNNAIPHATQSLLVLETDIDGATNSTSLSALSETVASENDETMTSCKDNSEKLIDFSPPASPTDEMKTQEEFNKANPDSQEKQDMRSKFTASPSQSVDSDPAADAEVTSLGSDIKEGPAT